MFAEEVALAHRYKLQLLDLPLTKDGKIEQVRIERIRNAHVNTANQLSKTLKLGPGGRNRYGMDPKTEEKPKKTKLASLRPKRIAN